ncbi:hypothetical protein KSP40_PGU002205 [Platanthera guangdongensis]|uniref:Uncharacterized protein n=1 Tax=Platanthera guangdongensis TaxID=2320717 RepID=A0ABR2LF14_9ASPA
MGTYKRFWHSRPPPGRPTRWAISLVVEHAPNNCVVVPGLKINRRRLSEFGEDSVRNRPGEGMSRLGDLAGL